MVIIEPTAKDDLRELVADLMAITTAFSARIYGKRGDKKGGHDRASSNGHVSRGRRLR